MSTETDRFHDATGQAGDEVEFPDIVETFETLGFTAIGRLGRGTPEALWREAAAYPKEHRLEYCTHLAVPPVMLTAPDRSAFVVVTWWWGMPDVRIRTVLSDGSVVETMRGWDREPVWRRGLAGAMRRHADVRGEQLLNNSPHGSRTVTLADGPPADLWAAHQRAVTEAGVRRGSRPLEHRNMTQAVALANRLARHQRACYRAMVRRSLVWWPIVVPVVALVVAWAVPLPAALLILLFGLVWALVVLAFARRVRARSFRRRYTTSWRPALPGDPREDLVLSGDGDRT